MTYYYTQRLWQDFFYGFFILGISIIILAQPLEYPILTLLSLGLLVQSSIRAFQAFKGLFLNKMALEISERGFFYHDYLWKGFVPWEEVITFRTQQEELGRKGRTVEFDLVDKNRYYKTLLGWTFFRPHPAIVVRTLNCDVVELVEVIKKYRKKYPHHLQV